MGIYIKRYVKFKEIAEILNLIFMEVLNSLTR